MRPECKTCRFWENANGDVGYCHRRAPTINHQHNRTWPMTSWHDWCGEHESTPPNNPESEKAK